MNFRRLFLSFLPLLAISTHASPIVSLGTTLDTFAVLGASTVTNTGSSVINGNLGLSPGTSITGFPPGTVNGTIHDTDAFAALAQTELTTAYNAAASAPCVTNLTGQDLGGLTLTPGVYCFASSAQLTGILTLNALGDPNAQFVFQIGSTLTTASASSVVFSNGSQGENLFWQVGSSATLGTTTSFEGNILALTSITLNTNATIGCGRALARNGAVTLDTNVVSTDAGICESAAGGVVPEPGTATLFGVGAFFCLLTAWRRPYSRSAAFGATLILPIR